MKIRNLLIVSAFLMAFVASFGLKANGKFFIPVTYRSPSNPFPCATSGTYINCTTTYSPIQCTVYDGVSGTNVQAYKDDQQGFDDCIYPLYLH